MRAFFSIILFFFSLSSWAIKVGDLVTTPEGDAGVVFYVGQDRALLVDPNIYETTWSTDATKRIMPQTPEFDRLRMNGKLCTDYLKALSDKYTFPFLTDLPTDRNWFLPSFLEICIMQENRDYINPTLLSIGGAPITDGNLICVNEHRNEDNYISVCFTHLEDDRLEEFIHNKAVKDNCRAVYQLPLKPIAKDFTSAYLWSTGATTQQITDEPEKTTTYSVLATSNETGCQGTASKTVIVADNGFEEIYDTICNGETYQNFGIVASETGDYTSTVKLADCKSIVNLHLTVAPVYKQVYDDEICFGQYYGEHGFSVTPFIKGVYSDTLRFISHMGCDSVHILNLKINPITYDTVKARICQTEGYIDSDFEIQPFAKAGLNYYAVEKAGEKGCKHYHTLALQVDSVYTYAFVANVQKGTDYKRHGFNIKNVQADGSYSQKLKTVNGCDSTINLNITMIDTASKPTVVTPLNEAICEGGFYAFKGQNLTKAGIYADTVETETAFNVTELTLTIHPTYNIEVFDTLCSSDNTSDEVMTPVVFQTIYGCDSSVVRNIHYNQSLTTHEDKTICKGASYEWNGKTLTTAGNYSVTLTSANGCDSIVVLDLKEEEADHTTLTQQICQGGSYRFKGQNLTEAGTYTDTLTNQYGCDSIVSLKLTVSDKVLVTMNQSICQGNKFQFGALLLDAAGVYNDTTASKIGCDSITKLTLTVHPTYNIEVFDTLCSSDNTSDEVMTPVVFQTIYGCDSSVVRNIHYKQSLTTHEDKTICKGVFYEWNGKTLTTAGNYSVTLTADNGCDSIVVLDLKVEEADHTTLTQQICQGGSYRFKGQNLTEAGTYTDTLTNQYGCDSIVSLKLTVSDKVLVTMNESICQGNKFQFGALLLDAAGVYNDTTTSKIGCDSITKLTLTVHPTYNIEVFDTLCSSDNTSDEVMTPVVFQTIYGCDSSVVRNIHYNQSLTTHEDKTICKGASYEWNGKTLTTAGNYSVTLTSANGCDSIVVLDLKVEEADHTTLTQQICQGGTYHFKGQNLTEAGTYTDTLTNQYGCDSIVSLKLTVSDKVLTTIDETICEGESYIFGHRQINKAGNYADTLVSEAGCDSIVRLTLSVSKAVSVALKDTVCEGEDYDFGGESKPYPSGYVKLITRLNSANGCDSTITMHLTVLPASKSTLYDTTMVGETYAKNGFHLEPLSKAGRAEYVLHTNNEVGCDSIVTLCLFVRPLTDDHIIPTVFSPSNQDGNNDVFMEGYEVYIYDRYGNLISHSDNGWDGKYRGEFADPGVYIYVVTMKDGQKHRGTVEVLKN